MADVSRPDGRKVIRLSARYHYFAMADSYCTTPDCPCRVVNLEFVETDRNGVTVSEPIRFSLDLNIDTWCEDTESERSDRTDVVSRLVEDFLANLSDEMKATLRERHEKLKSRAKALASFTMPVEEVMQGILEKEPESLYGRLAATALETQRIEDSAMQYAPVPN